MTYPITLTSSGNIVDIGEYRNPLPLLDIPPTIEQNGKNYIFYCESAKKTNNDLIRQGDGSKNNPFVDVNHALEVLCCFAKKVCAGCISFELRVTGFVNYTISPRVVDEDRDFFDGNGVISISLNEASWAIDSFVDYTNEGDAAPPIIEWLKGFEFHGNSCVNNVSGVYPSTDEMVYFGGGPSFIRYCEDCSFSLEKFSQFVTSESNGVTFDSYYLIHDCTNCEFNISNIVVTSQSKEAQESIDTYVEIRSISGNSHCRFKNISVHYDLSELSGRVTGNVDVYNSNSSCSFVFCTASIELVVGPDAYGCGFSNNRNTTWLGENVGYCFSWLDFGDEVLQACTTNADCGHEHPSGSYQPPSSSVPPSSSYEPPSSSYVPPSSSYEPTSSGESSSYEPSDSSSEPHPPSSSSSSYDPGDTSKGYVRETGYQRILNFKTTPNFSDYHGDEACKADYYYSRVSVHEGHSYGFSKLFAEMATIHGEVFEEEDENGDPVYYCELPSGPYYNEDTDKIEIFDPETEETSEIQLDIKGLIAEIGATLQGVIKGEIHSETASPEAVADFPSDGWTGYKWYRSYHANSWVSDLVESGQTLTYETNSHLGYYDTWGGIPCGTSAEPVTGSITVNTSVFEWVPNEDYDGPAPKKVILVDGNGNRHAFDFGVEYCPTGLDDVEHEWFKVVSCGGGNNEWAVPAGVVTDTGWENKNKTNRTNFTYDGVLF